MSNIEALRVADPVQKGAMVRVMRKTQNQRR